MSEAVVIGVSGSEHAHPAISWGVDRALAYGLRIELVHVVDVGPVFAGTTFAEDAIVAAEREITLTADRISSDHPELATHGVVLVGQADEKLADYSRDAALLVIGTHRTRLGELTDLYSRRPTRIASAAECSVVVVPSDGSGAHRAGVVVGVDGSELSTRAVRFGAEEASRLDEPLTVVHAWAWAWRWGVDSGADRVDDQVDEEVVLAESGGGLAEDFPDLVVERRLTRELPVEAICSIGFDARLVALGSNGRTPLERFWLGSVSTDVLLRMPAPVAIVR